MDVLILPSHEGVEGMGRVLAEAQACGVATIGSDITGVREIVPHGVGLRVRPQSPGSIAEALHAVFSQPTELVRLQNAGRAFALAHFDSKHHARSVEQAYHNVLDSHLKPADLYFAPQYFLDMRRTTGNAIVQHFKRVAFKIVHLVLAVF